MATYVEGRGKAFTAGEALGQYVRVKLSAGEVVKASDTDKDWIGVTVNSCADGDAVTVWLRSAEGTIQAKAAGTFAVGAPLYAAANGLVDDSGTVVVGIALSAATAANDFVEMQVGEFA